MCGEGYQLHMVIQLKVWSTHKIQAVVQFLNPRNVSESENHQPVKVNKNDVMCQQNTAKWCAHFTAERISTGGSEISGSNTTTSTPNKRHVNDAIHKSIRIVVNDLHYDVGLSRGTSGVSVLPDVSAVANCEHYWKTKKCIGWLVHSIPATECC